MSGSSPPSPDDQSPDDQSPDENALAVATAVSGWAVERATGSAAAFHARDVADPVTRQAWVLEVVRPALVLGSTQAAAVADGAACAAAGVEVVRRRSGGGAVLLDPGQVVWMDLVLPRHDPLWDDDVGRAAAWVGRTWAAALAALDVAESGAGDLVVHEGGLVRTPWSTLVCFAGLGPGEVTRAGAKVVGVSSRRTRGGARFQCACALGWEPGRLAGLLALASAERARLAIEVAAAVHPVAAAPAAVVDAVLAALPV